MKRRKVRKRTERRDEGREGEEAATQALLGARNNEQRAPASVRRRQQATVADPRAKPP